MDFTSELMTILMSGVEQYGVSFLSKWTNQCIDLLTRAKLLEAEYIKMRQVQVAVESAVIQNYQETRVDLKTDNLVREMYVFLNEVGETLRNEQIMYQVTLTQGKGKSQVITSFELPLEKFLEITSATHTRLTLSKTETVLNRLLKDSSVVKREWSTEEIFNYQRFIYNAKRVQQGRWKRVNRGNLLEAYSRYEDLRRAGLSKGSTTIAMRETLKGTQGFWQGPDYQGFQIKGNAASVANIYTCINQINELYLILKNLQFNSTSSMEQRVVQINGVVQNELDKYSSLTTDELLQKLATQFGVALKT